MTEESILNTQAAERAEFETVVEALARSPRLARLLRYLGERYFLGESDQLHEYNIATEVFGRSKTAFDSGEDAIARVEAHRLRKKLKLYYETEGKEHLVQLWIPSGTYVPVFTHHTGVTARDSLVLQRDEEVFGFSDADNGEAVAEKKGGNRDLWRFIPRLRQRWWIFALAGGLLLVLATASLVGHFRKAPAPTINAEPAAAQPASSAASGLPIRILAGYTGKPQVDSAGAVWQADHWFSNGGVWLRPPAFIARTSDPLLFERWRTGDFFYDIPLPPGSYELHLYFTSTANSADAQTTFTVGINGASVLVGFDINSDAMGSNIADERVFRDVSPDKDGFLHLRFTSERGAPSLNALEILQGTPHQQLPIRLVTQPTPFTDSEGHQWHPDDYFMNGHLSVQRQQVSGSPDSDLFAAERYGHFSYAIPADTRDSYTVVLHFAELYFGPHASGVGGVGDRLFRVMCNGNTLLDNFDIYKEAGSLNVVTKTFRHIKPSAQGKINLTFEPIVNNATVSGIEVLDEAQ
jgi:hypothetical protein